MADTGGSSQSADTVSGIDDNILIPLLVVLSLLVLALATALVVIVCRRRLKARRENQESRAAVKAIKAITNGKHMVLQNEDEIKCAVFLGEKRKPDDTNDKETMVHSVKERTASETVLAIENEVDAGSSVPPLLSPRPIQTMGEDTLQQSSAHSASRLRGRRSKDIGLPTNGASFLVESKEATLKRASHLFRSDTKAFEFYTKTVTNYEMKRDHLKSLQLIGRGNFGCVYMGEAAKLPNSKKKHMKVAIKTMKSSAPDSDKQSFLYELETMKLVTSLNHPNIISLLGCVTRSQPPLIVLELMTKGNLQKFLRDIKSGSDYYNLQGEEGSLGEHHLLKFALDIARGMEGVADLQLLHRDLAARNILIDDSLTCKVADFGFAKDVLNKPEYKSKSVFQRPRPTRWLPPESLFTFKHCIESDVWSYGIVLWEIVTMGNLPYPNMNSREVSVCKATYFSTAPRQINHRVDVAYITDMNTKHPMQM